MAKAKSLKNLQTIEKLKKSILGFSVLGILIVGVVIAIAAIYPLYSHLQKGVTRNLLDAAKGRKISVEQFLSKLEQTTWQITSRTKAREKLEQYNRGEVNLQQFASFSKPLLEDALDRSLEAVGCLRFDKNGKSVVQAGLNIPESFRELPRKVNTGARVQGPFSMAQELYMVIGAPILDRNEIRVGADLVMFRLDGLRTIVQDYRGLGKTGETILGMVADKTRTRIFFPIGKKTDAQVDDVDIESPLGLVLKQASHLGRDEVRLLVPPSDRSQVFACGAIPDTNGWVIGIRINAGELYAPIRRQLIIVCLIIFALLLLGVLGTIRLLQPLAGKMIVHAEELADVNRQLVREVEEREQAEEKLLRSDQRLRLHSKLSPLGFLEWDENFHAIDWNDACERIFGFAREEAIGRHAKDLILPIEVHDLVDGIYQSLMNQTGGQHSINENVTKDGRIIICEWFNTTLIGKDGKAIGVASIVTDITERKKSENALALKNRINEIFLTFPDKEMFGEVLQVVLELTESPYGIFAYIDEEETLIVPTLTGEVWEECRIPGKDIVFPRESWGDSIWGRVTREKRSICSNISFRVPDGHIPIKRALGIPIIYQGDVIGHFLVANREKDYNDSDRELLEGIADSISPMLYSRLQTEHQEKLRKQTETEIKHLKNHLTNIIDSMPSMLIGIDNHQIVNQWNRQAETATGILAKEAVGRPVKQMFPDLSSHIETLASEIRQRRAATLHNIPVEKGGDHRFYDLMAYPLLTNGTEGAVLRIEDVTEQTRIQNLMVQTEKMMSLGGLAAGMAHEINNPLGIIGQAAQNIERRVSTDLPANAAAAQELGISMNGMKTYFQKRRIYDFIGSIREASLRASRIIQNILRFSSNAESFLQPASPAAVMDQALELAASDYDLKKKYDFKNIEIIRDYAWDIPETPMFVVEMEQVMLNLLKNAAQAMAANPPDRKPRIAIRLRREDRYALFEVADNGPGMTEEVRRRVFEPFFTTKEPGIGTGLGLSVSYMIITQNHRGMMEAVSPPGQGACFRVRLPLSKEDTHEESLRRSCD